VDSQDGGKFIKSSIRKVKRLNLRKEAFSDVGVDCTSTFISLGNSKLKGTAIHGISRLSAKNPIYFQAHFNKPFLNLQYIGIH
jgi:hypothetical protein